MKSLVWIAVFTLFLFIQACCSDYGGPQNNEILPNASSFLYMRGAVKKPLTVFYPQFNKSEGAAKERENAFNPSLRDTGFYLTYGNTYTDVIIGYGSPVLNDTVRISYRCKGVYIERTCKGYFDVSFENLHLDYTSNDSIVLVEGRLHLP